MRLEINNLSEDRLYREQFVFTTINYHYNDISIELDELNIQTRETTRKKFKSIKDYCRLSYKNSKLSKEDANEYVNNYGREKIIEEVKELLLKQIEFKI